MHGVLKDHGRLDATDPPTLLAMLLAARRVGNRRLEASARRLLEDRHGITVRLGRDWWRPDHAY